MIREERTEHSIFPRKKIYTPEERRKYGSSDICGGKFRSGQGGYVPILNIRFYIEHAFYLIICLASKFGAVSSKPSSFLE
jgi:hypothetical protein